MSAIVEKASGMPAYWAYCRACPWIGSIHLVSSMESMPNYRAIEDANRHDRKHHWLRWLLRGRKPKGSDS